MNFLYYHMFHFKYLSTPSVRPAQTEIAFSDNETQVKPNSAFGGFNYTALLLGDRVLSDSSGST
jgi:hypothetical protein